VLAINNAGLDYAGIKRDTFEHLMEGAGLMNAGQIGIVSPSLMLSLKFWRLHGVRTIGGARGHQPSQALAVVIKGWDFWVLFSWFVAGLLAPVPVATGYSAQGTSGTSGSSELGKLSLEATAEYRAALKALELESYDVAAEGFRVFLQKHPQDPRVPDALFRLGLCEFHLKHFQQAAEAFGQAASRSSDRRLQEDAKFNQGISQLAGAQEGVAGLAEAAVTTFEEFLRLFPQSARRGEVAYCLGEALYMLGRKDRAIECYREALKANVQDVHRANTLFSLGVCLEELDKLSEAATVYEEFLRDFGKDPRAGEVAVWLGDILFRQKRFENAQHYFAWAASFNDPKLTPYALVRLGDIAAAAGQWSEAARQYREVQLKFPKSEHAGRAALEAGKAFRRLQQWAEAIEELRRAAEHSAWAEEAAILTVETWIESGRPAEALKEIERVQSIVVSPVGKARLQFMQAEALAKDELRKREALEAFRQLAQREIDPQVKRNATFRAAQVALELDDPKLAREFATEFAQSASQDPRVAFAHFIIAESFLLENQLDESDRMYSSILTRYPADRSVVEAVRVRKLWVEFLRGNYTEVKNRAAKEASMVSKPSLAAEIYYLEGMSNYHLKQFSDAAASFLQALKLDPSFRLAPETSIYLGRAYLGLKQWDRASQVLQELLGRNPPAHIAQEAQFWLAEVDYQSGRKADAIRRYEQLLPQVQDSDLAGRVRLALASVLAEEGLVEKAVAQLDDLLTKFPNHPLKVSARLHRARLLWELKRIAEMVRDLENLTAESVPPSSEAEASYLLANGYLELKEYDKAIRILEALRQTNVPNVPSDEILYQLGWAYELAGKKDAAKAVFEELASKAEQSPLGAEALYHLAEFLFTAGAYREASHAFYQVLQRVKGPRGGDLAEKAAHRLGWCQFQMGNFARAEEYFAYQLKYFPEGSLAGDTYFLFGECLVQRARAIQGSSPSDPTFLSVTDGRPAEAKELYRQALDNFRRAIQHSKGLTRDEYYCLAVLRASEAAGQLGNWEESRRFLEGGKNRFANSPYLSEFLCSLGWTYWQLKDAERALKTLQEAVEAAESSGQAPREVGARARFLLGEIHFHNKAYREAIREFLVVAYGYGYPAWQIASLFEAARCYEEQGRGGEALKLYQEIVKNFSDSKDPKVGLARQKIATLSQGGATARP